MDNLEPEHVVAAARAFLRGHYRGDLRFDEHLRPVRYVVGPDGRPVASVMVAMIQSHETVLFIPEEGAGAMEMLVTLEELDEDGPHGGLTDRWRIYHGDPEDVRWAFLQLDAARFEGCIIDGEGLLAPNPLAADEPAICRHMNTDHAVDLSRLCLHFARRDVEQPVMVGIDPDGIDVRRAFDVIRVPAAEPMPTAEDARRVLAAMADEARLAAERRDA